MTDADSEVWRGVVVYDAGPDTQGHGEWVPLELGLLGPARRDGGWEPIGTVSWNSGSVIESRAIELTFGEHVIERERLSKKGRESFFMKIDRATEWRASDSQ